MANRDEGGARKAARKPPKVVAASTQAQMIETQHSIAGYCRYEMPSLREDLARELVNIFMSELCLKRFVVISLLSIEAVEGGEDDVLDWADELYDGEFDDLRSIGMLEQHNCHLAPPQIKDYQSCDSLNWITIKPPNHNSLEVYLTLWISDMNIDMHRVKKIFSIVEEEMHAKLLWGVNGSS